MYVCMYVSTPVALPAACSAGAYIVHGASPAGCLPSLATIPIFIGLYRSLTNVAREGLLESQGFYWIPSLAGPTSVAARQSGSGTAWLFPLVDGHPPIGWHDASLYCVLPVLLVVCQWVSSSVVSPPIDPNADNANTQKALLTFLPLMIGWFALSVPSGLALYYFSNTILTSAIQIWLRKLGGATVKVNDLGPVTKVGSGRRLGPAATDEEVWTPTVLAAAAAADNSAAPATAAAAQTASYEGQQLPGRWAKRKKLVTAATSSSSQQG